MQNKSQSSFSVFKSPVLFAQVYCTPIRVVASISAVIQELRCRFFFFFHTDGFSQFQLSDYMCVTALACPVVCVH